MHAFKQKSRENVSSIPPSRGQFVTLPIAYYCWCHPAKCNVARGLRVELVENWYEQTWTVLKLRKIVVRAGRWSRWDPGVRISSSWLVAAVAELGDKTTADNEIPTDSSRRRLHVLAYVRTENSQNQPSVRPSVRPFWVIYVRRATSRGPWPWPVDRAVLAAEPGACVDQRSWRCLEVSDSIYNASRVRRL